MPGEEGARAPHPAGRHRNGTAQGAARPDELAPLRERAQTRTSPNGARDLPLSLGTPGRGLDGTLRALRRGAAPSLLLNSALLFAAMMWFNLCGYLFNVIAGRVLGPADFGALVALVAVLQIISVPTMAIQTTAVKFMAERQNDSRGAYGLLIWLVVRVGLIGMAAFLLVYLLSAPLATLLKIDSIASVAVMGVMAMLYPLLHLAHGALRGLGRFGALAGVIFGEGALKVGLLLVYLAAGLALLGAVSGLVLASLVACVAAYVLLGRPGRQAPLDFGDSRALLGYGLPVLLTTVCGALLVNVDLVLARHLLPPHEAGQYAAISLLGKVIFYGSDAVVSVMFPLVAASQSRGDGHRHLLWQAGGLVVAGCGLTLLAYFLVPELVVGTLFGSAYVEAAPYLGPMGVAAVLFALAHVQVTYALALRRLRYLLALLAAVVVQPSLLFLFHAGLEQIVLVQLASMGVLAAGVTALHAYPRFRAARRSSRGGAAENGSTFSSDDGVR